MDVIVIFDLYGYGGHRQMVDVVAVPEGSTDQDAFDAWVDARSCAAGRENVVASHAFLSTTLKTIGTADSMPAKPPKLRPQMIPEGGSKPRKHEDSWLVRLLRWTNIKK